MARNTRKNASATVSPKATFTLTTVSVRPVFKDSDEPGAPRAVRMRDGVPCIAATREKRGGLWPIVSVNGEVVRVGETRLCDAPVGDKEAMRAFAPAAKLADLARLGFAKAKAEAKPAAEPAPAPAASPSAKPNLVELMQAMRAAGFTAEQVRDAFAPR